jgi:hypothetical protein
MPIHAVYIIRGLALWYFPREVYLVRSCSRNSMLLCDPKKNFFNCNTHTVKQNERKLQNIRQLQTCQLLVCVDDVNLLGDSINAINENS